MNRKIQSSIIVGALAIFALAIIVLLFTWIQPNRSYLKPTYLPQDIMIKDAYLNVTYPSDVSPIIHAAIYVTTNPSMNVSAYRSDDGSTRQLDCSQQVQDQTCTRKVTQNGLTYFVFDSLNSTLNTHSIRVRATNSSDVIDISIEPPLSSDLDETYDWSRTLDSLIRVSPDSLPVHEERFGG